MTSPDRLQGKSLRWCRQSILPWKLPLVLAIIQIAFEFIIANHTVHSMRRPLDLAAVLLLIGTSIPLLMRFRYPRIAVTLVFAVTSAYFLIGYPYGPAFLCLIAAIVSCTLHNRRVFSCVLSVIGFLTYIALDNVIGWKPHTTFIDYIGVATWLILVLVASELARSGRDRRVEAIKMHQADSLRRASEERLQIANELHDTLAHNISIINVRAGVALHLIDEKPEETRLALEAIKIASKDALSELRSVLDILRRPGDALPLSPTVGLEHLEKLIETSQQAGLEVALIAHGTKVTLTSTVDLASFRIIQESLTNIRKHTSATMAMIDLDYGVEGLTLTIRNDGSQSSSKSKPVEGNGIIGMRERITALHGTLEVGPRKEGGFIVRATIPYGDVA